MADVPTITALTTVVMADGSFSQLFDSIGAFLDDISAISWPALLAALVCQGLYLSLRTRAWFNGLRAAYPGETFRWRNIWAAEIAGNGISSVVPAHAGAFVRLYLGRTTVKNSNYATVGSSFMVDLPFDIAIGVMVLTYGFTQGVFPKLPDLSSLNAFDLSFLAQHPRFAVFFLTAVPILLLSLFAWASVRVRDFWQNVRQGVTLLTRRDQYLRRAALPQAAALAFRVVGIGMMLKAFNLPAGPDTVLTVMAVQMAASLIPLTPQGAGVQQALLLTALAGAAATPAIAAYSVGQQMATAVFNAGFGLIALAFVFRTTDWRSLIAAGRAGKAAEEAGLDPDAPVAGHDEVDGASATTLEYRYEPPEAPRDY